MNVARLSESCFLGSCFLGSCFLDSESRATIKRSFYQLQFRRLAGELPRKRFLQDGLSKFVEAGGLSLCQFVQSPDFGGDVIESISRISLILSLR